ncbi:MAG: prolyl oligopeptidase family protein [Vicinamibacterales bacterium]
MAQPTAALKPRAYPQTRSVPQTDTYHGVVVADPYRWLEDLDAPDTAKWVEAQNAVTFDYLEQIPSRASIRARLTQLWDYERFGVPSRKGARYFYEYNSGLLNQAVLYVSDGLNGTPRILLDPNTLSADGTIALTDAVVSDDGELVAYSLATAGSDWNEIKVRRVTSGLDEPDHLRWVKFSGISWTNDNKGFFYSRYDEPAGGNVLQDVNYFQKLYYHAVGTPQSADRLIYERRDEKEWGFGGEVSEDGRYLIISVWQGTDRRNRVFFQDLAAAGRDVSSPPTIELLNAFDAQYVFVGNDGPTFWFFTDKDAPRGRIVAIDTRHAGAAAWKTLVPESSDTIDSVHVVGNQFVVTYMHDAANQVKLFNLAGAHVRDLDLPGLGATSGFTGERASTETFYSYESFNTPATIYRFDFSTGRSDVFRTPKIGFDPAAYVVRQVFYTSRDGTRIPMFISHRRDVTPGAATPALLYGYGGFNIAQTPGFRVSNLVWMEMGGIYAVANIRGGGEYGKAWHEAGTKLRKQNVFDDFIAAAEWLTANGLTSRNKLAISGGSNGGLLVGAVMTQRPDLVAATLPAVGVMDMLRFHKFTIGWAWVSDYGSSDVADEFKALYAYSPLHTLKKGTSYPATLVTTADHDDRVVPSHSFKFAAALQAAQGGSAPVLIRIETKAGHGAGKPTSKQIEEAADRWAFLVQNLGMTPLSTPAR